MKILISNAKIHSMDRFNSVYNSMIMENDRIIALGDYKELKMNISSKDIVWDADSRTIIPGMTDSHIHFLDYSLSLNEVSLRGVKSIEKCKEIIKEKVKDTKPGDWITGGGWDKSLWGDNFPNKDALDKAAPDNPVYLISKDCHTSWVNSLALYKAKIDNETFIEGGEIEKSKGELTGILKENAQSLVKGIIPYPTENVIEDALMSGIQNSHSLGFTAVHSMSLQNDSSFNTLVNALRRIRDKDLLKLRFTLNPTLSIMEEIIRTGIGKDFKNDFMRLGAIKLFADGSLGSQSAWMTEDYIGRPGHKGMHIECGKGLDENIRKSISLGFPVAVHAIGDRANQEVLDIFEKCQLESKGLRHRIEHAQILCQKDIKRFATLGVIASVQPIHLLEDVDLINKFWGKRGRWAYPFQSLLNSGAVLTFGSDSPVEDLNPFIGIYAAVSRQRVKDATPFYKEEKVSVYDAIKAYTQSPAFATCDEIIRGTLEQGKKADFVILNKDVFTVAAESIKDIKVITTVVDGKVVYGDGMA
ncbi:MAG: amidohydrolase [Clostridiales bacterium]|nr:amidohydrolase [Clostridiales bacterium]